MNNGWITVHRRLLDWEWFDDSNTFHVFMYCLLRANHKANSWRGNNIDTGQFITSREKISQDTKLSIQQVRTCLNKLKSTNELTIKTTNKFTLISITNWSEYQQSNQQDNQQLTNNQPTTNQQLTTNNNDNNDNNVTKKNNSETSATRKRVPIQEIVNLYHEVLNDLPRVAVLSTTRKSHIRQRWNNQLPDIEAWRRYFEHIKRSDWLMGRVPPSAGRQQFIATIDYVINESNLAKIIEGKYHDQ